MKSLSANVVGWLAGLAGRAKVREVALSTSVTLPTPLATLAASDFNAARLTLRRELSREPLAVLVRRADGGFSLVPVDDRLAEEFQLCQGLRTTWSGLVIWRDWGRAR